MNREGQQIAAEKIRAQYAEKGPAEQEFDKLRELDREVKRPVNIFTYVFGTVGSLVMGTGMCLAMDMLGEKKRIPGILIGIVGIFMMCINYPVYKKMLDSRKKQYAQEILKQSEKVLSI